MTQFIDKNNKIVKITITDRKTRQPMEKDFFEVGGLRFDEQFNAYRVDDVEYLIDRMTDYRFAVGDFYGEEPGEETASFDFERVW